MVRTAQTGKAWICVGTRLDPRLVEWIDEGIQKGTYKSRAEFLRQSAYYFMRHLIPEGAKE